MYYAQEKGNDRMEPMNIDGQMKKHKRRRVYAKTLEELREKEEEILKDRNHGIKAEARYKTLNELFDVWKQLKRD